MTTLASQLLNGKPQPPLPPPCLFSHRPYSVRGTNSPPPSTWLTAHLGLLPLLSSQSIWAFSPPSSSVLTPMLSSHWSWLCSFLLCFFLRSVPPKDTLFAILICHWLSWPLFIKMQILPEWGTLWFLFTWVTPETRIMTSCIGFPVNICSISWTFLTWKTEIPNAAKLEAF